MYYYRALSLDVTSELELPQLGESGVAGEAGALTIRRGPVTRPAGWTQGAGPLDGRAEPTYLIAEADAAILVRAGREIIVDAESEQGRQAAQVHLVGSALAVALSQRGRLVLHGCAIRCGAAAAIIMGPARAGKSTLGMALDARGHLLLADDTSVIGTGAATATPLVATGFPRAKLWPDSVERLGLGEWRALPRVRPSLDKCVAQSRAEGDQPAHHPLAVVCALEDGPEHALERLAPGDAMVRLVGNTYAMRAWPREALPEHLRICAALIAQVPIYRLVRPRDLAGLDALVDFVDAELLCAAATAARAPASTTRAA